MKEMVQRRQQFLTVAPFQCAWDEDLRFKEAGRGCISFEAFAQNDVTLVFREQVGSQHYHYKMDNCPNYTVILGSHRNRRLKIEVSGKTVVDIAGIGLCSSSFESYWISIYDGQISIGKGKYPFQDIVVQWTDSEPNYSVQYIGLSSWDKHVGYRNIVIFPLNQHYSSLWRQIRYKEYEDNNAMEAKMFDINDDLPIWGLSNFLESWVFSDVIFLVGSESLVVPAHKVILSCYGNFSFCSSGEKNIIPLPSTTYPVLHAFLEYIYTGHTQIVESQRDALWDLSVQFEVISLIKLCEGISGCFNTNKLFNFGTKVEMLSTSYDVQHYGIFPCAVHAAIHKLKHFLTTGEHSDVNIYVEEHGLVARSHKLILSIWSSPFEKMFTNGMVETNSSNVTFKDVHSEAFSAMLCFMYCGELDMDRENMASLLIPLVLLADEFGINHLQRECCKFLLECISEDTVCPILLAIASVPSCKLVEEACKRIFSTHFDYCTTANTNFVFFDDITFKDILQHADLTVTSEERVLDAILMWCMNASECFGWIRVDELLSSLTPEELFGSRLLLFDQLLPLVRFPLMPSHLLMKLEKSRLSEQIAAFGLLVKEAIQYCGVGPKLPVTDQNTRFQHRHSSFKELLYMCDGDNNGVIYFAGTSYGEHPWVNPVLAKKLVVSASSPPSRYTDPKALVSRVFQATSFSGACVEDGRRCAWWMVDIGQDHQLMCNYYTLRQDGSTNFPRSWTFQGSLDGMDWSNLRVHENDHIINRSGQFASWPVIGPNSLLPFRFFRVCLSSAANVQSNALNLCICFIELYGYFH